MGEDGVLRGSTGGEGKGRGGAGSTRSHAASSHCGPAGPQWCGGGGGGGAPAPPTRPHHRPVRTRQRRERDRAVGSDRQRRAQHGPASFGRVERVMRALQAARTAAARPRAAAKRQRATAASSPHLPVANAYSPTPPALRAAESFAALQMRPAGPSSEPILADSDKDRSGRSATRCPRENDTDRTCHAHPGGGGRERSHPSAHPLEPFAGPCAPPRPRFSIFQSLASSRRRSLALPAPDGPREAFAAAAAGPRQPQCRRPRAYRAVSIALSPLGRLCSGQAACARPCASGVPLARPRPRAPSWSSRAPATCSFRRRRCPPSSSATT